MVEVIVASSIFSLLLLAIFGIFRSGSSSFSSGSWRIHSQKNAQIFLNRVKEVLEKANNAEYVPVAGDISVTSQPIFINAKWRDKFAPISDGNVMMFSICRACVEKNDDLNIAQAIGSWTGVVLLASKKTLRLYRTGSINALPTTAPARAGSPNLTRFAQGSTDGVFSMELSDVASLSINYSKATGNAAVATATTIMVTIELQRSVGNKPTDAKITQSITANLVNRDQEILPLP